MQSPILFYSWQSDSPAKLNKWFIEKCLDKVSKTATKELALPDGLIVDRDTKGLAGTPAVSASIFEKISSSAVLVADVSFVGKVFRQAVAPSTSIKRSKKKKKSLPNPNVLLELGYAASAIGWDRVILVMNSAYGDPDEQIFDLVHRRFPITYCLRGTADGSDVKQVFTKHLTEAVVACLQTTHSGAEKLSRRLNRDCLCLIYHTREIDFFPEELARQYGLINPRDTIDRLLDLGLLYTDHDSNSTKYAYHWTYIGTLVRQKIFANIKVPTNVPAMF